MSPPDSQREKYSEPIRTTLIRTFAIALGVGTPIFLFAELQPAFAGSRLGHWISWVTAVLWFSFGGHWVEIVYLNYIRMSLPMIRWLETVVRLLVWFLGGGLLFIGMKTTTSLFGNPALESFNWWHGGLLFIIVELVVHTILSALKRNSFWNGRG